SSNGTFVNDFRVAEFPIKSGDRVRFGELRFVVCGLDADGRPDRARTRPLREATRDPEARTFTFPPLSAADFARTTPKARGANKDDWALVPEIASCVFGAIVVRDYEQLRAGVSEIGVQRLETALGRIVAQHLDGQTHAFRAI